MGAPGTLWNPPKILKISYYKLSEKINKKWRISENPKSK